MSNKVNSSAETVRILLIHEDMAEFSRLENLLSNVRFNHYQLDWCEREQEAVALVHSGNYDIALLDYHGFYDQGRQLLKSMVSQGCLAPIIVMTNEVEDVVDHDALELGAADYLVKNSIDAISLERSLRYALERKRIELLLEQRAHYDLLTQIPNRILFRDRLEQAIKKYSRLTSEGFALFYIDLDRFKQVNDTLGHDAGDILLNRVAGRIQSCLRASDSVARIGGDEFTVLLENMSHSSDVAHLAQKIIDEVSRPVLIQKQRFSVGCSIGIAVYPEAGLDADSIQKHADLAMYRAKAEKGGQFRFYTEKMNVEARDQLLLEEDLRLGITRSEFKVHYQPKVCIKTGNIKGVEALVRWLHPEKGLLMPASFIPLAEETGLISPIGMQVVHQVCKDLQWLKEEGYNLSKASINLSFRQFLDDRLVENIAKEIKRYDIQPGQIEFELTETAVMENIEQVGLCMRALENLGVTFSLDDFGTGYSSFVQLEKLPISALKIDCEFIQKMMSDTNNTAIVKTIINLAHGLGKQVVAEGVETDQQRQFLLDNDCDDAQGYYFSKALPLQKLTEFVGSHQGVSTPLANLYH